MRHCLWDEICFQKTSCVLHGVVEQLLQYLRDCAGLSQCEGMPYGDVTECLPNWLKVDEATNAKTPVAGHDAMLCPLLTFSRPSAVLASFIEVQTHAAT